MMTKIILKISKYITYGIVGILVILIFSVMGAGYFVTLPDKEMTPAGHTRNSSKYLMMREFPYLVFHLQP